MRSDAELLAAHVAGDAHAFGQLAERHADRLWTLAYRTLGNRDDAADALQDAMISAFRRASSFRGGASVLTWLHRIVVNACLDLLRRKKVRAADPLPEQTDHLAAFAHLPDDPAVAQELRDEVAQALGTLGPDQRSAVVLVDMLGYSVNEAAEMLGCPTGTVKSRCARARAALAGLLAPLWGTGEHSAASNTVNEGARS